MRGSLVAWQSLCHTCHRHAVAVWAGRKSCDTTRVLVRWTFVVRGGVPLKGRIWEIGEIERQIGGWPLMPCFALTLPVARLLLRLSLRPSLAAIKKEACCCARWKCQQSMQSVFSSVFLFYSNMLHDQVGSHALPFCRLSSLSQLPLRISRTAH